MKIGVYVGSFNPVHKGHLNIANMLIKKKFIDRVIFIPTGNYWNKQNLLDLNHRINMLKLFENDVIIVDTEYNNCKYTYQILNAYSKYYDKKDIYLIIGADQLPKFHLWKNIDKILKFKILVINRNNIDTRKYINKFKNNNFIVVDDIKQINISSTEIRNNKDCRKKFLDEKVLDYINKYKLYI